MKKACISQGGYQSSRKGKSSFLEMITLYHTLTIVPKYWSLEYTISATESQRTYKLDTRSEPPRIYNDDRLDPPLYASQHNLHLPTW